MDLVFCDRCHASIPAARLETARARAAAGGALCDECAASGVPARHSPLSATERRRRRESWVIAAAIGAGSLLFTVAAVGVLFLRLERVSADWSAEHQRLREEFRGIRERDHDIEAWISRRIDEAVRALASRTAAAPSGVSSPARAPIPAAVEVETPSPPGDEHPGDGEAALRGWVEAKLAVAQREWAGSDSAERDALLERLNALEERVHFLTTHRVEAAWSAPRGTSQEAAAAQGEEEALRARLASPEATVRAAALFELAAGEDPQRARYLLPLLRDPDPYVRETAARILERLGARIAVQHLLDALEDEQVRVREAALAALRAITGQDLYFDPRATARDRRAALALWREWWRTSWKAFLYDEAPASAGASAGKESPGSGPRSGDGRR